MQHRVCPVSADSGFLVFIGKESQRTGSGLVGLAKRVNTGAVAFWAAQLPEIFLKAPDQKPLS